MIGRIYNPFYENNPPMMKVISGKLWDEHLG